MHAPKLKQGDEIRVIAPSRSLSLISMPLLCKLWRLASALALLAAKLSIFHLQKTRRGTK
ncbi:hypothetical protein ABD76_16545 [Paenibacillus dendritiformis]|nr:hypothetical protein [Paenibacillus dendritiformis]